MPGLYTYLIKLYLESLGRAEPFSNSGESLILLIAVIGSCALTALLRSVFYIQTIVFGLLLRKTLTAILYQKLL